MYCATANSPSQMYFDTSIFGILEFKLDRSTSSHSATEQPPLPEPESRCPTFSHEDEDYFFTSAVLDGVTEVSQCKANVATFGPAVMGLLFRYADGRQGSVGQIRPDKLVSPVRVNSKMKLYLHFGFSDKGCPHLSGISFEDLREVGRDEFLVSLQGTLEWWFS